MTPQVQRGEHGARFAATSAADVTGSSRRWTRGMSLIEALGATALVGIALLGLGVNSISLTRADKTADAMSAATALAQEKLEELRSMPLGAAQLTSASDPGNPMKGDGTPSGTFSRSWVVSARDTPALGLKTVTVTVAWTDSRAHTVTLAAYVRCSAIPCP